GLTDSYILVVKDADISSLKSAAGFICLGVFANYKEVRDETSYPQSDSDFVHKEVMMYYGRLTDYVAIDDVTLQDVPDSEMHTMPVISGYNVVDADSNAIFTKGGMIIEVPL